MKAKAHIVNARKIGFELRAIVVNPFMNVFGVGLPMLLAAMISQIIETEAAGAEASVLRDLTTVEYLGLGAIIPLATVLIGYSTQEATEIEKGIAERMRLFGISVLETMANRVIAQLCFITAAFGLFFLSGVLLGNLSVPSVQGAITYLILLVVLTILVFGMGHGIATLCGQFGLTFFVSMAVYFGTMILSGMMGISYEYFPAPLKVVAKLLPTRYLIEEAFIDVWKGASYNYGPLLQAYLFFAAISGLLVALAVHSTGIAKRNT